MISEVLTWVALKDGASFTQWGPCMCGGENKCLQCHWAGWLERLHLDPCEEYELTRRPALREWEQKHENE